MLLRPNTVCSRRQPCDHVPPLLKPGR